MKRKCILALFSLSLSISSFAAPFQAIDKESFKGVWPFSFAEAQLQCLDGAAYVMNFDDNQLYALTGLARIKGKSMGALPLEPNTKIWLNNPEASGLKMSLGDVTSAALALCDK